MQSRIEVQSIILPALNAIERASAEAITRAGRRISGALSDLLSEAHTGVASTTCSSAATAAPVARQAEFAAHARTHRTPQSLAGT
jgi:hypothetical protein